MESELRSKNELKRSSGSRDIEHAKSSNFIGGEHFRPIKPGQPQTSSTEFIVFFELP